ncbi:MAG: DODA-type extradiol aromatic ring-opening family dioxygenase [Acidimicrobiales bacterium]
MSEAGRDPAARMPTAYLPHGGGPCFFMDWTMGSPDTWDGLARFLRAFASMVGERPDAVVVISGHHEGDVIELTTSVAPPMLFDYYGFPRHTYELTYPAPGSPAVADAIAGLLNVSGIAHRLDPGRGFDHGVFVPFLLMYPEADIPIVQMSLHSDLDPAFHLELGQVIAPLRETGVLIVGSGMSYHNMAGFMTQRARHDSEVFDDWLAHACSADPAKRWELLTGWARAPAARAAHPREEHLLPLMVVAGAAGDDTGARVFSDVVMGARVSAHAFGSFAA